MDTLQSKSGRFFAVLLMALFVVTMTLPAATPAAAASTSAFQFRNEMRKLWEDHITWTRLYLISAASDLPDKDLTAQRLLQNQVDIGAAIKPFYGNEAGDKLAALLKDHILGAVTLVAAAKSGNKAGTETGMTSWQKNGDEIAAFLSGANPENWPLDPMKAGMKMHLDMTFAEAGSILNRNSDQSVADYDRVHAHILGLADTLSDGIISQFPDKFEPQSDQEFALYAGMRKLWEDHITWTRLYIISAVADLPDKDATAGRLLQNQVDIGNAVKPYFGDAAGDKLTALLKDHILGAIDLVAAAKADDQAAVQTASAKWYSNGDDIAAFLSAADPTRWPATDMKAAMKMHLDLTLQEAVDTLQGKIAESIADYDRVHGHILMMADALSGGLAGRSPAASQPAAAVEEQVAIRNFSFESATLTVKVGTTVTWENQDGAPHTITGTSAGATVDSGRLTKGAKFSHTFDTPGRFEYHCAIHPNMQGVIVVES